MESVTIISNNRMAMHNMRRRPHGASAHSVQCKKCSILVNNTLPTGGILPIRVMFVEIKKKCLR
jgi:hypothetical protein